MTKFGNNQSLPFISNYNNKLSWTKMEFGKYSN